jgi:Secretion system C-terminal sorting domain/Fibronectin type III domain
MKRVIFTYVFAFLVSVFQLTTISAQPCAVPTNLTATSANPLNATFSWAAVSGATYYKIKINPVASPQSVKNYTSTTPQFTAALLSPSENYECQVASVCASGTSAYSNPIPFSTTTSSSCGIPQNISTVSLTPFSANIKWSAVTGTQSYLVKLMLNGTVIKVYPTTNLSMTLNGLKSESTYTYIVCSVCNGIPGAASIVATFITPSPTSCGTPQGVFVSKITNNSVKVNWNEVIGANYYKVTLTSTLLPIPITNSNIQTTSFDAAGLLPNTTYTYTVAAVCSTVESAASQTGTFTTTAIPCSQPSNISANSVAATTATINFTKGATGINPTTRLYLTQSGQNTSKMFSSSNNSIALSNLLPNTLYSYQITSVCNGSENVLDNFFTITTAAAPACAPPINITVNEVASNSAKVTWTPITGVPTYTIKLTAANGISSQVTGVGSFAKLNNLMPNMAYSITVSSNCYGGQPGTPSTAATITTTNATNCNAPVSLNVTNINVTKAKFAWNAISGINVYRLIVLKAGATAPQEYNIVGNSTTLSNLEPNATYSTCVAAICNSKVGVFCPVTTFSTLTQGNCPPPTNLITVNTTANSAKISWDSLPGTMSWSVLVYPSGKPTMNYATTYTSSYEATNLQINTAYDVVVIANCPNATLSASSIMYSFTTAAFSACALTNEPNNTLATATPIAINTTTNTGLQVFGDVDYFTVTTTAAQPNLKVTLKNLPFDFDLKIYSSTGTLLKTSEKPDTLSDQVIINTNTAATYKIMVYGYGNVFSNAQCYALSAQSFAIPGTNTGSLVKNTSNTNTISREIEPLKIAESNSHESVAATTPTLEMKIYPNPTNGIVNVSFSSEIKGEVNLLLSDAQGKIQLRKSLSKGEFNNEILQLDLSGFNNGVYFLSAQSEKMTKTYKVIVNRL